MSAENYMFKKAMLHELAAPSSVAATPDVSDATAKFGAEQGRAKAQTQALQSDERYAHAKMAEEDRQFMTRLDLDRQRLDDWADANRWATAIAIGNLGLTGLGFHVQSKKDARTETTLRNIAASYQESVRLKKQHNSEMKSMYREYLDSRLPVLG